MRSTLFIFLCFFVITSCDVTPGGGENDGLPSIFTSPVTNIEANMATGGAFAITENGSPIFQKGLCWDTIPEPVIDLDQLFSNDGGGTEDFTTEMEWLLDEQRYYVRAYAWNDAGLVYGDEVTFETGKVELDIPCNPEPNSVSFNFSNFTSVETGPGMVTWGNYGLVAHAPTYDFYIGFDFAPRSGVYRSIGQNSPTDFLWTKECSIDISNHGVVPGGLF